MLWLAACGPEKSGESQDQLLAETQKIALDYQTNHNLDQARAQVDALKVANPNQWLIYVAETVIAENNDQASMTALATLTDDLGLQSEPINQFAVQHNLLKGASAVVDSATQKVVPNGPTPNVQAVKVQLALTPTLAGSITQLAPIVQPTAVAESVTTTIASANQPTTSEQVSTSLILVPTPALPETATAAELASTKPMIKTTGQANMRSGPGTAYTIAGALQVGDSAEIIGKNDAGDWWEIVLSNGQQGWVFGQLTETSGDVSNVTVAANIPPPPPTDTPAPATAVPPTAAPPAADTPAAPTPVPNGNEFVMVQRHLWDVIENGGQLDGPSVTCGQARELIVNVLDANGNRLNGVAVQVQYGAKEIYVTGAQGKGDGVAEFVLGGGQDVKVIKDTDGRDVSSDVATGLSTKPWDIPYPTLIEGRFCQDDASCKSFVDHTGCYGHYSWTVTFKRQH